MRPIPVPELELLLRCARMQINAEGARRISGLVSRDPDWDRLILTARHQGLIPLLYRTLRGLGSNPVPAGILERLRAMFEAIRVQNLVRVRELLTVLRVLEEAGVTAMPYKGPALAVFLCQDLALREFKDIDLLVRQRDAVRAKRVLMDHGFVPKRRFSDRWDSTWVRIHSELVLTVPDMLCHIDISWRAGQRYWCLPEIPDSIWRRQGTLSLLGTNVRWPAAEDLLLILCLHGSKHKWEELKWIVDVAELLRTRPGLDWRRLTDDARSMGAYRMLAIGLLLASELLDASIPKDMLDDFRSTPSVACLAAEICADLSAMAAMPLGVTDPLSHLQGCLFFLSRAADRLDMRLACRALPFGYFVLYRVARPALAFLRRALAF
jgi:hypothetical protein